ncbi:glycosyltransferase family 4 protein [Acidisphaera sp. L21]|uniref:glycosyltransferase family 4 protein n=1 Tax=Acidisphaera sp. L21 TaxID=1641851 RepID=UPI00131D7F64|nr:glycosyltransferase family 4 protein [Acidisphaera sp. L21]
MADKAVYFQWSPSSFFGWGVYGLNLMLHSAGPGRSNAVSSCGVDETQLRLTPLERLVLQPSIDLSNQVAGLLGKLGRGTATLPATVLHALGNDLALGCTSPGDSVIEGERTIGMAFFEQTRITPAGLARAARYETIIAGSGWNRDVLEGQGVQNVRTVLQGVDQTSFHPAPKSGVLGDRFIVFSGGKLEYRKGQDLVVAAFRVFAQRHADALLVTAWTSPWAQFATTLNHNASLAPISLVDGKVDALGWTVANGIPAAQVLHLGRVANADMPRILREADVGLFPNRAEGGTNLVAMEAMACGVPCMLSMNTGHLDLVGDGLHCLALGQQRPVDGDDCLGWGESDVDEIVAVLEAVYQQRDAAAVLGQKGAALMQGLSWPKQIAALMDVVAPVTQERREAA